MKKVFNKKNFVIIFLCFFFFIFGAGLIYIFQQNQLNNYKKFGFQAMNNCYETVKYSNYLADNCASAYNVMSACLTNVDSCNMADATKKLTDLNNQKAQYQQKLSELNSQVDSIVNQSGLSKPQ